MPHEFIESPENADVDVTMGMYHVYIMVDKQSLVLTIDQGRDLQKQLNEIMPKE